MRPLFLVLLVTLCLPLQAGDPAALTKAVEMFRSPHAGVRAEGSRIADTELRRLLAPFIKAMADPDPEVRRRVREAILKLVPHHDREAAKPQQHVGLRLAGFVGQNGVQIKWFNNLGVAKHVIKAGELRIQLLGALQLNDIAAQASVLRLGLAGMFVVLPKHGQCFRVDKVTAGSAAAKTGLLVGDTILNINKRRPSTYKAVLKALGKKRNFAGAAVKVLRGGKVVALGTK